MLLQRQAVVKAKTRHSRAHKAGRAGSARARARPRACVRVRACVHVTCRRSNLLVTEGRGAVALDVYGVRAGRGGGEVFFFFGGGGGAFRAALNHLIILTTIGRLSN